VSGSEATAVSVLPSTSDRPRALGGVLVRREGWRLSWLGRWLVLGAAVLLFFVAERGVYPFLAITSGVSGDYLVVDGWIPPYTLNHAATEFAKGHFRKALVVRPVYDIPNKYESGRYATDFMANTLVEDGVPKERVIELFCSVVHKDRTYCTAQAVKEWLATNAPATGSIDVITLGPHARRTRLLYQRAFGGEVKIGVVAIPDRTYDPAHWWRSSEGVREVPFEALAYLYAKFLFHP